MPDNVYFRQPLTQDMMLDILFVWCKMHPAMGYRQGMHELLATVLWAVERDAVENIEVKANATNLTLTKILDSHYIEHDTYALFSVLMQSAETFYVSTGVDHSSQDTSILARSSRIFGDYLPKVDPELFAHLTKLGILPQIFLL